MNDHLRGQGNPLVDGQTVCELAGRADAAADRVVGKGQEDADGHADVEEGNDDRPKQQVGEKVHLEQEVDDHGAALDVLESYTTFSI